MVDKLFLTAGESVVIDTTNNILEIVSAGDNIGIYDANNNKLATLAWGESYVIPANTGKYTIKNDGTVNANVYVFRMFYI